MRKKFHIQGPCFPKLHFMADTSAKQKAMIKMALAGDYFVISRPRQFGKTTTLRFLAQKINEREDFIAYPITFEGMGEKTFADETAFCRYFFSLIEETARFIHRPALPILKQLKEPINNLGSLSSSITDFIEQVGKKVVILIDEVDSSSNHQLFLEFLGMLRKKYLQTHAGLDFTFHSVILVGVHDIKTLKLKIRSDKDTKLNSPWNIAAEFTIDMSFSVPEIIPMLEDYVQERGVQMDIPAIAQQLHDYTSGYPFLVSKICKVMDEAILPEKTEQMWTLQDLENAVGKLLPEENFNFDSLTKNLENNPDLYAVVRSILLENRWVSYNIHNPIIKLGVTYGIFKNNQGNGRLQIHNQIYQQVIYNYMVSKIETDPELNRYQHVGNFYLSERTLDMNTIILQFQSFMKEHHSDKDEKFLEREGRLIFLAYLKPIINGKGYTFVEAQISQEKRMDVVITYYDNKYIVELKRWYSNVYHQDGLVQLADYLERQNHQKGWLVIFDFRKNKKWESEPIRKNGKDIFAVWV